jgi:hypothetical protein
LTVFRVGWRRRRVQFEHQPRSDDVWSIDRLTVFCDDSEP